MVPFLKSAHNYSILNYLSAMWCARFDACVIHTAACVKRVVSSELDSVFLVLFLWHNYVLVLHWAVMCALVPHGVVCFNNEDWWLLIIAELKDEASNRDALSFPVCIYVCMYACMYVCIYDIVLSVPVNPRHLDCAIARCSPQVLTTTQCSIWPPSATKLLNSPLYHCMLHSGCC